MVTERYSFELTCILCVAAALWEPTTASADSVNHFPVRKEVEAFRNTATKVQVDFRIYFPVDDTRYVRVSDRLAALLSVFPKVQSPDSMKARVLKTSCTPQEIRIADGFEMFKVTGGLLECEVEVTPNESVEAGTHEIILAFKTIDAAFAALEAKPLASPAEVRLSVRVWPSQAAKEEDEARQREEARRKQQLQEAENRRQAEAIAREQVKRRVKLMHMTAPWAGGMVSLGVLLFLFRHRLWPHVRVQVSPGGHEQIREVGRSIGADVGQPFGTLVETVWARDLRRRRHPIKVEYLAGVSDGGSADDVLERAFRVYAHGEYRTEKPPRWTGDGAKLDVLVSAGASVRRGTYLAVGRHGSVKVKVR